MSRNRSILSFTTSKCFNFYKEHSATTVTMRYENLVLFGSFGAVLAKWQPVDEAGFRKAVESNEQTLVACEKTPSTADVF